MLTRPELSGPEAPIDTPLARTLHESVIEIETTARVLAYLDWGRERTLHDR